MEAEIFRTMAECYSYPIAPISELIMSWYEPGDLHCSSVSEYVEILSENHTAEFVAECLKVKMTEEQKLKLQRFLNELWIELKGNPELFSWCCGDIIIYSPEFKIESYINRELDEVQRLGK